jgi:hypothetical protein
MAIVAAMVGAVTPARIAARFADYRFCSGRDARSHHPVRAAAAIMRFGLGPFLWQSP